MTTFREDQIIQRAKRNEWRRRKALENHFNVEMAAVFGFLFLFAVAMGVSKL